MFFLQQAFFTKQCYFQHVDKSLTLVLMCSVVTLQS